MRDITLYHLIDLERTEASGVIHYWRQNFHGYTVHKEEAGVFPQLIAISKVNDDFDKNTAMSAAKTI